MEQRTCPVCRKRHYLSHPLTNIICGCGAKYYGATQTWLDRKINKEKIDRNTALSILKEFSRDMYPSYDLFGKPTLVIDRDKFEVIRHKYLD